MIYFIYKSFSIGTSRYIDGLVLLLYLLFLKNTYFKTARKGAVFCLVGISIQHSVLTCRHFPDDSWCRCPFYEPASEHFGIFGFEVECQCRNHFEVISLDNVPVSAAGAADNAGFIQNSAFENRSDIRVYGSSEYLE